MVRRTIVVSLALVAGWAAVPAGAGATGVDGTCEIDGQGIRLASSYQLELDSVCAGVTKAASGYALATVSVTSGGTTTVVGCGVAGLMADTSPAVDASVILGDPSIEAKLEGTDFGHTITWVAGTGLWNGTPGSSGTQGVVHMSPADPSDPLCTSRFRLTGTVRF